MTTQQAEAAVSGLVAPTAHHSLFNGTVEVMVFGLPHDYSDFRHNFTAIRTIMDWAKARGVRDIYVPDVRQFNAKVVSQSSPIFSDPIRSAETILHFGTNADGVWLEPNTAFFVASGDCPTFIAMLPDGRVAAAHAGRDSLIDRESLRGGKARENESVVLAILKGVKSDRHLVRTALICGIGPANFIHPNSDLRDPEHFKNHSLVRGIAGRWGPQCINSPETLGPINLPVIVESQILSLGIPVGSNAFFHDGVDTFGDKGPDGEHLFHSVRRKSGEARNGVLVIRRGGVVGKGVLV